jgi:cellulose synthase/poly-beta-1,6-N-acetylglucosamine synthase-like glycosyltransferase
MKCDPIANEYLNRHRKDCSCVLMRWWQVLWYVALLGALLFGLFYRWDVTVCVLNFFFGFWYFSIILFRSGTVLSAMFGHAEIRIDADELSRLDESTLPVYTVLVPLYREANIADKIVPALDQLDYPPHKLDIKLLLEEDDKETIAAVHDTPLAPYYDVIIVPDSWPKTKPKACNYGLKRAKGELCVIYDAEDRPERDQLKKVALAFRKQPPKIACIQAKLNFYNSGQNLLTRWFCVEYSTTFDLLLPGLQYAEIPIPLGGTSNHFHTRVLQELDGWDPFNVTEDCDLGIRLYRRGYRTRMIDSTTWEEACSRLPNWFRQRSRWVKGFFQTHLTHMRNPFRTLRDLGLRGFFGFLLSVGGSSLMMVLNVFYWLIGGFYLTLMIQALLHGHSLWEILKGPREMLSGSAVWPMIYYGPKQDPFWSTLSIVFFVVSVMLLLANLLFVLMHCLACVRRKWLHLLPFAILMPFYWVLISIGAWKGFIQLFTNPFYWEKTPHGQTH